MDPMPARAARLAAVALLLAALPAPAQTLTWDPGMTGPTTGPSGGTGTWDTTNPFWFNGTADVAWPGATAVALFGGPAGTFTVPIAPPTPGTIAAGGLTFNTSGYTIAGDTLTLAGGGTVNVTPLLTGTTTG